MLKKLRKKKGQSTLEYAILAVIIIAALLAMRIYLQQGIQGKMKDSADQISSEQFNSTSTIYNKVTTSNSTVQDTVASGTTTSVIQGQELTNVDLNSYTP